MYDTCILVVRYHSTDCARAVFGLGSGAGALYRGREERPSGERSGGQQ